MQVAPSGGQIRKKCKLCNFVTKFNPSYGVNFWVRCASGNVYFPNLMNSPGCKVAPEFQWQFRSWLCGSCSYSALLWSSESFWRPGGSGCNLPHRWPLFNVALMQWHIRRYPSVFKYVLLCLPVQLVLLGGHLESPVLRVSWFWQEMLT